MIFIIVYGSLYPFHLSAIHGSSTPLSALLQTWRGPFGRGDFFANVLLYLPFGLFATQTVRLWRLAARISLVIFCGLVLSLSMELLQFYDEGRVSALADVYANTIGVAVGSVASAILFRGASPWRIAVLNRRPFVVLVLSSWLGYRLFPYVPVIDLHKYWNAVKPLVFSPHLPLLDLYRSTVIWLAVALLIEALSGAARSRVVLPAAVLAVLFARILIADAALSPAEVAGGALAVGLWCGFLWRSPVGATVIAALFAGGIAIEALQPFQFSAAARPFGWIPFRSFMYGSVEVNIRSLLEKAFIYGALIWLVVRAGSRFAVALVSSAGFVLCLRLIQVFLPGRSAEVTDFLMVLIAGGVMRSTGENPNQFEQVQPMGNRCWQSACVSLYEILTRNDSVQPVDLILVLAGKMERKRYGLELYRAGVAPRLVLSVGRFEVSKMPQLDLEWVDELKSLRDATPPADRNFFVTIDASGVRMERENLLRCSTYGEALAFRRLLEHQDGAKVMVVSTDVHLRRVASTFAKVFRGTAIRFLYCPVPTRFAPMSKNNWWRRPADRRFVFTEMMKLAGYRAALSVPDWAARRLMLLSGWGRK